jgi:hypothetical protein
MYTFTRLPYSSHIMPSIVRDTTIISKMDPKIVVGLLKIMV